MLTASMFLSTRQDRNLEIASLLDKARVEKIAENRKK